MNRNSGTQIERNTMTIIELQLDEKTLELAQRMAKLRHSTLESLIKDLIELLATAESTGDPITGMFAQEPELIDRVVASAMEARERDPLRLSSGQSTA